ncbi:MAG: maleylacetate reductase [Rhodospirillaceae bacterium]|nr:maleylacetate reductase [Rhodospirillaceae bacterium]
MIDPFTYTGLPTRVIFGPGKRRELPAEVERLGASRALVISTPEQRGDAEMAAGLLGSRAAGIHDTAIMHTPMETVHIARRTAAALDADCYVTVGGGTAIGLGKGIALESEKPVLALPTTYAGSEMTTIQGFTEGGVKTTKLDPRMLPKTVIYDPELTLSLPPSYSGPSGMNAIAHAVEALYGEHANPITSLIAEEGIRALGKGLPKVCAAPDDLDGRTYALYGSWLCGIALGGGGMGLHHKLCHVVGGSFDLGHAPTHTVILPHAMAYNAPAAETAMARVCRALDAGNAPQAVYDLIGAIGAPLALKDIGMPEDGLDRAADLAVQNPYYNPRAVTRDGVRNLLEDAFQGRRPAA